VRDETLEDGLAACGFLAAHAAWAREGGDREATVTPMLARFGGGGMPDIAAYTGDIAANLPVMRSHRDAVRASAPATATVVESRLSNGTDAFVTEWTEASGGEGCVVWRWRFGEEGEVRLQWPPLVVGPDGRLRTAALSEAEQVRLKRGIQLHDELMTAMMAAAPGGGS